MRLCSGKLESNMGIHCLAPTMDLDSSPIQNDKPVKLVSFHPLINPCQLITIWISDWDEDIVMATSSA